MRPVNSLHLFVLCRSVFALGRRSLLRRAALKGGVLASVAARRHLYLDHAGAQARWQCAAAARGGAAPAAADAGGGHCAQLVDGDAGGAAQTATYNNMCMCQFDEPRKPYESPSTEMRREHCDIITNMTAVC